jgi:ATP-dependent RNA circularization protein (DNA/RNA ligase family)
MYPPRYLRVPHLVPGRGTSDDLLLQPEQVATLLAQEIVVEEKLDGANVVVWCERHRVECALRAGPGAADRAGQLGPLKAWAAERTDILRQLLVSDLALYGEWLYLTHTVAYDRLPSYFVALDLRRPDGSFLTVDERTAACESAGVAVPPELWRGTARGLGDIEGLLGMSRYGPAPAEGIVVRTVDGSEPRVAKLLRKQFNRLPDDAWAAGRPRNRLADGEAAWR